MNVFSDIFAWGLGIFYIAVTVLAYFNEILRCISVAWPACCVFDLHAAKFPT